MLMMLWMRLLLPFQLLLILEPSKQMNLRKAIILVIVLTVVLCIIESFGRTYLSLSCLCGGLTMKFAFCKKKVWFLPFGNGDEISSHMKLSHLHVFPLFQNVFDCCSYLLRCSVVRSNRTAGKPNFYQILDGKMDVRFSFKNI